MNTKEVQEFHFFKDPGIAFSALYSNANISNGEGVIPHEAKTGIEPALLTLSFPYARDWINEHPFRNEPNARLICNLLTGAPVRADTICTVMKQLRERIIRLLKTGEINISDENEKLEYLIKTKKWNPYSIRHSAITSDSDFLPEYALNKKSKVVHEF